MPVYDTLSFKEEWRLFGFFYLMQAIYWISVGFMAAYWILYFYQLGVEVAKISLMFLVAAISSLIFEIPTGVIADTFGRKFSVFLSYLLSGLCYVGIILVGTSWNYLLILYFILGISYTFETGALESWFIDTIKFKGKTKFTHKLLGRQGSIAAAGFVIGPLLGGILSNFGLENAFWATAITMLFLTIYVLFGKEEYFRKRKTRIIEAFKESFVIGKCGLRFVVNHSTILILVAISFLFALSFSLSYNSYQPYVTNVGLKVQYLGYALSIAGFISIFSLNYSASISKFLGGERASLIFFAMLFGLATLFMGIIKILPLLFLTLISRTVIYELMSPNSAPAFRYLFNKFVPSKIRATVGSSQSFVMRIGDVVGLALFGLIGTVWNLEAGIIFAGILAIISSVLYLKIKNNS